MELQKDSDTNLKTTGTGYWTGIYTHNERMSWAEFLTTLGSGLFSIFCADLDDEMQSFINFEDDLKVGRERGWKHFFKLN